MRYSGSFKRGGMISTRVQITVGDQTYPQSRREVRVRMSGKTMNQQTEHSGPIAAVEDVVERAADVLTKPRMRGWIHFYSAWLAIICGTTLVSVSWAVASPRAGHATLIYAAAT